MNVQKVLEENVNSKVNGRLLTLSFFFSLIFLVTKTHAAQVWPGLDGPYSRMPSYSSKSSREEGIPLASAPTAQYVPFAAPVGEYSTGGSTSSYYPPMATPVTQPVMAQPIYPQDVSPQRMKIAAAEALYYNQLRDEPFNYQEIAYLKQIINGNSDEGKCDFSETRNNFWELLQSESQALARMDRKKGHMDTKPKTSCFGANFGKVKFISAEQIVSDLSLWESTHRMAQFEKYVPKIKVITHEELFTILASFPQNDQPRVYDLLAQKVFTKMSFYSPSFFSFIMSKVKTSLVAKELVKSGDPLFDGIESCQFDGSVYIKEVLKSSKGLDGRQLVIALKMINQKMIAAKKDKDMLRLKERLRQFTSFDKNRGQHNEWTASDLFVMGVSVNISLLVYALDLTKSAMDARTFTEVSALVNQIMHSSRRVMHNISTNPHKTKMWSPERRGINISVIEQLVEKLTNTLSVYQN